MTTVLAGIAAFVVLALAGWAIAETKSRLCGYNASDDERQSLSSWTDTLNRREREMDIDDVMATISTKGFKAV